MPFLIMSLRVQTVFQVHTRKNTKKRLFGGHKESYQENTKN
jgi:hypothetical protein